MENHIKKLIYDLMINIIGDFIKEYLVNLCILLAEIKSEQRFEQISIKDLFGLTEEELKHLCDLAEHEAINKFTTAEVHIDQNMEM